MSSVVAREPVLSKSPNLIKKIPINIKHIFQEETSGNPQNQKYMLLNENSAV